MSVLQEAGAIHQWEEHGWMQDRVDPHARDARPHCRFCAADRRDGISPDDACPGVLSDPRRDGGSPLG
jgi:hypothetical protein